MDGSKPTVGHVQGRQRGLGMPGDFGTLAMKARAAVLFGICRHASPDETASKVAQEGIAARVDQGVDRRHEGPDEGCRDYRA